MFIAEIFLSLHNHRRYTLLIIYIIGNESKGNNYWPRGKL